MVKNKRIELLCPAGDLERLKTAVIFGADAVYCGLPDWSLRNPREITFSPKTLREGIEFAHKHKVKVYVTFNVFLHERQLKKAEDDLKKIKGFKIDGIVVSDFGMLSLVKKHLPNIPIHISTQTNTLNSEAVKFWKKLGAKRIVLARELMLEEIKKIQNTLWNIKVPRRSMEPTIQLEVFGHGAMCIAYSGRCLLSKYFTGREANLGDCAQSCRWRYKIKKTKNQENKKSKYYIEEENRPGNLIEIQEDPNGTYFLNSKEICSLDILDKFIEAGIDALKIEGRAKTPYYLATVTRVYRKAIDLYYEKKLTKNVVKELMAELNLVQNRGYSHGFLLGKDDYKQEYNVAAFKPSVIFIGVVVKSGQGRGLDSHMKRSCLNCASQGPALTVLVEVKNKFKIGDKVEIVTPNETYKAKVLEIKTEKGKDLEEILTPQEKVWVGFENPTLTNKIPEGSILRKRTNPVVKIRKATKVAR